MRWPGDHILAEHRQQGGNVHGLTADDFLRLLQSRQRQQILDDARHAIGLAAHLRDRTLKVAVERGILAERLQIPRNNRKG